MIIVKLIAIVWLHGVNMAPVGYELGDFKDKASCEVRLEEVKKQLIEKSKTIDVPPMGLECISYGEF